MDESILSDFFLNFYTARERSFRLLIGREGVRVDILPALCHSRDAGFPRGVGGGGVEGWERGKRIDDGKGG